MSFSIIIPAHNEEKYIGACLESIEKAKQYVDEPVEVIVSLNRCTDKTEQIAEKYGAHTTCENKKNL
jgi:glycosyltransferase involved in cell wall biosynthesis